MQYYTLIGNWFAIHPKCTEQIPKVEDLTLSPKGGAGGKIFWQHSNYMCIIAFRTRSEHIHFGVCIHCYRLSQPLLLCWPGSNPGCKLLLHSLLWPKEPLKVVLREHLQLEKRYVLAPVVGHSLHAILFHSGVNLSGEGIKRDADSRLAAADGVVFIVWDDLCGLATDGEGHSQQIKTLMEGCIRGGSQLACVNSHCRCCMGREASEMHVLIKVTVRLS